MPLSRTAASTSVGIAAVNDSVTRFTRIPRDASWPRVPPGHGSLIGSATGVPATSDQRTYEVDIWVGWSLS